MGGLLKKERPPNKLNKIREFIEGFSKAARLHKKLLQAIKRGQNEEQIARILSEVFNERHTLLDAFNNRDKNTTLTDEALSIYRSHPTGFLKVLEAGLDLTKEIKRGYDDLAVAEQLQELVEAFEISRDRGYQLLQIRNDKAEYRHKLLEVRLEKEYGDIGIQLAQFAKKVNWDKYDVEKITSLAKSKGIDIPTMLEWFEKAYSKGQVRDLERDLDYYYKTARLLLEHNAYDHKIIYTAEEVIEVENPELAPEIKHSLQSLDENQRLKLALVLLGVSPLDSELALRLLRMILEVRQQGAIPDRSFLRGYRIIAEIEEVLVQHANLVKPEELLRLSEECSHKYGILDEYQLGTYQRDYLRSTMDFVANIIARTDETTLNVLKSNKISSYFKWNVTHKYLWIHADWNREVLTTIASDIESKVIFINNFDLGAHREKLINNIKIMLEIFNPQIDIYSQEIKDILSTFSTSIFINTYILSGLLNNAVKESNGDKHKFIANVLKNDSIGILVRQDLADAYLSSGIEWDKDALEIIGSQPSLLERLSYYLEGNPQRIQQLLNNETILKKVLLIIFPQLEKGFYFGQERWNIDALLTKLKNERRFRIPGYLNEYIKLLNTYLKQQRKAFNYSIDQKQAEGWSYEKTAGESIGDLLSGNRADRKFSGHLAMHQTKNWQLLEAILTAGYIIPADIFETLNKENIFQQQLNEGKVSSLVATEHVHFSIDQRISYLSTPYAFVYPLEMLLENQAFMLDPLTAPDWAVGGFSANPEHESHKIPVRQAVILVPKMEQEKMEGLFNKLKQEYAGWKRPERIFYYEGQSAEEGLAQLQAKYNLKTPSQITVSSLPKAIRKLRAGKFKCDIVGSAAISLLSIKDVRDINGIIKYHELPYLSRLPEVQDFSSELENLAEDILSDMLIGEVVVKDTGSSNRGTYQERYLGFPDDFDLMANISGNIPDDALLKEFAKKFADKLGEKGCLKAIYEEKEFIISPDSFISQKEGRKLVKLKIFRENEKNIPILSIDINFFSDSQGADGIRYQGKFWENLDKILFGLNDKDKEEGKQYILSVIRSLKAIFKNNGVYSWMEGGLRGVGTEQLVLQLNGVEDEFGTPKPAYSLDELKKTFNISRALQLLEDAMFNGEQFAGLEGFKRNLPLWDPGSITPRRLTDRVSEAALIILADIANEAGMLNDQSIVPSTTERKLYVTPPSTTELVTADLGAQLSHVKNLGRLLDILNVLRKSENVPEVSEDASYGEIIEFCINELRVQGLIEETTDEYGNRIIKIKKEAEDNRLVQAIRKWVIGKDGKVKAINFQGRDGIWIIVGFASELDEKNTLEHEQKEIAYRKQGYSWIDAHNMAVRDTGIGTIIDEEDARQYKAGRQDEIGVAQENKKEDKHLVNILYLDEEIKKIIENLTRENFVFGAKENHAIENITEKFKEIARILESWDDREEVSFREIAANIKKKVNEIEDNYLRGFYKESEGNPVGNYSQSFKKYAMDLNSDIVKEIFLTMNGYYVEINSSFNEILSKITSFNELLNLVHAYILENQWAIPLWAKESQDNGIAIRIKEVIDKRRKEIDSDLIYIISFKDKEVFMQIRDYGHALSIKVSRTGQDKLQVEYKIPKSFGRKMVEGLRGFYKYFDEGDTAMGSFEVNEIDIGNDLVDFIKKVPTDSSAFSEPTDEADRRSVPPGMGGTGFLPRIFNNIVDRLNSGQPLILTSTEREVLLWGLLNPDSREYFQTIAILAELNEPEVNQLKEMAGNWAHPKHDIANKLESALKKGEEIKHARLKLGEFQKINPQVKNLIEKSFLLWLRNLDIDKVFISIPLTKEIGNMKLCYLTYINEYKQENINYPQESPFRYETSGVKERYMVVDLDEMGDIKAIWVSILRSQDRDTEMMNIYEDFSLSREDNLKLQSLRDKLRELIKKNIIPNREKIKTGDYAMHRGLKYTEDIERTLSKSPLFVWLLLQLPSDITISNKLALLRREQAGGIWHDFRMAMAFSNYKTTVHEFAHGLYYTVLTDAQRKEWEEFITTNGYADYKELDPDYGFAYRLTDLFINPTKITPEQQKLIELCGIPADILAQAQIFYKADNAPTNVNLGAENFQTDNKELRQIIGKYKGQIEISQDDVARYVPEEIKILFEVAKELGLTIVITGGTARDFAIAAHLKRRLPMPVLSDIDIAIIPKEGSGVLGDGDWAKEKYELLNEELKKRGYGYKIDFSAGIRTADTYVFENFLNTKSNSAFGLNRLAVAWVGSKYIIFGTDEAINDLKNKVLSTDTEKVEAPGKEMTTKMIGKVAIYRDLADFRMDNYLKESILEDINLVKSKGTDAIIEFMKNIFEYMKVHDENDKPTERLRKTIREFDLSKIFGLPEEELIELARGEKEDKKEPPPQSPGGIDFRALPITTQPTNMPLIKGLSPQGISPVININLNEEWSQIQNMLNAGVVPSSQRIKEYVQACCQGQGSGQEIDKVLTCIADIFRLEEERVSQTDPTLKEFLVLLESDKSVNELESAISKITVAPSEPKSLE
jgi:hypothetical protein